jgi:hypothetical protein
VFTISAPSNEDSCTCARTGGGRCFIATAAYGSEADAPVVLLRQFRDGYMSTNSVGAGLVSAYYRLSPAIAELLDDHPSLKPLARLGLAPAVASSALAVEADLASKVLIGCSLALISALLMAWIARRLRGARAR